MGPKLADINCLNTHQFADSHTPV